PWQLQHLSYECGADQRHVACQDQHPVVPRHFECCGYPSERSSSRISIRDDRCTKFVILRPVSNDEYLGDEFSKGPQPGQDMGEHWCAIPVEQCLVLAH